ncbi:MAG: hypothetical protein ACK40S_02925 [Burkholderiaceae bacterium]
MRSTTLDRLIACRSVHKAERSRLTFVQVGDELVGYDRNHRAQEWRRVADGALICRAPTQAELVARRSEIEQQRRRELRLPLLLLAAWASIFLLGATALKRITEG